VGQIATENASGRLRTFTYDAQRQLTLAGGVLPGGATEQYAFGYDGIGNRLNSEIAGTATTTLPSGTTAYVVNAVNQYTALTGAQADTPTYDLNGNTTALSGLTLRYDEANRLVEAADATRTIRYVYDGRGRRVERAEIPLAGALTATRYVYDGWRVVEELDGSYATLRSYTRGHDLSGTAEGAGGIGGLLALARPVGGNWTAAGYHYDGTGNVTALVADDGTLAAAYTYGPYGERLTATGPIAETNPYQFSGKERDGFTGYYYYGYRYYNPTTGRWLNRDPIEEEGGVNLYGMVGNNPVGNVDMLGLATYASVLADINYTIGQCRKNYPFVSEGLNTIANGWIAKKNSKLNDSLRALSASAITLGKVGDTASGLNFLKRIFGSGSSEILNFSSEQINKVSNLIGALNNTNDAANGYSSGNTSELVSGLIAIIGSNPVGKALGPLEGYYQEAVNDINAALSQTGMNLSSQMLSQI